jgi:hypothetical protein
MELGIDIELFSMNKPGESFDPSRFYQAREPSHLHAPTPPHQSS